MTQFLSLLCFLLLPEFALRQAIELSNEPGTSVSINREKGGNASPGKPYLIKEEADLPAVSVVPQDMGRVLMNLFANAFHAVQERTQTDTTGTYRPTVTVTTAQVSGRLQIRVHDNGTGISDDIRGKIFQPFFTTKPTGKGTGLGLSLSYDIVTKGHGGTLTVHSEPGTFTEFTVEFPA